MTETQTKLPDLLREIAELAPDALDHEVQCDVTAGRWFIRTGTSGKFGLSEQEAHGIIQAALQEACREYGWDWEVSTLSPEWCKHDHYVSIFTGSHDGPLQVAKKGMGDDSATAFSQAMLKALKSEA